MMRLAVQTSTKALLLIALAASGYLLAQSRTSGETAGQFDYYVLSLSWAPEFCAQAGAASSNPGECATPKGFVVHGLWPEVNSGKSPESCGPARPVSRGLVNELLKYMPSASLIQHEWATHGTCSGLTSNEYFTKALLAHAAIQIPVQIASLGQTETETVTKIQDQFAGSNPVFPKDGLRVICKGGAFTELRACFDKDIKGRACAASAGQCNSPSVTIRPAHPQ